MSLNEQQEKAAASIKAWFEGDTKAKQLFVLSGYAGTGKTYLINYAITNVLGLSENDVAFITPTGKAASVLIQRGRDAQTVHRLIYNAVEKEFKTSIDGKEMTSKRTVFMKKPGIPDYRLLVLDEVSMVDDDVMRDLMSYGIPILCSGDGFQLPPVKSQNHILDNPDAILTDIVRQSEDNMIVKIATDVRNGRHISSGNYGDVVVMSSQYVNDDRKRHLLLEADQILCGTNRTRHMINNIVRRCKGIDAEKELFPIDGEKVIFNVNNWEMYLDEAMNYNMVNGTIGYAYGFKEVSPKLNIAKMSFRPDFLDDEITDDILVDSGNFKNGGKYTYDMHQRVFLLDDGEYALKAQYQKRGDNESVKHYFARIRDNLRISKKAVDDEMIEQVDFAYCISVHKSQGSEWDNVVVFDEGHVFGNNYSRWLYTAITRAKKKLVILR